MLVFLFIFHVMFCDVLGAHNLDHAMLMMMIHALRASKITKYSEAVLTYKCVFMRIFYFLFIFLCRIYENIWYHEILNIQSFDEQVCLRLSHIINFNSDCFLLLFTMFNLQLKSGAGFHNRGEKNSHLQIRFILRSSQL